MVRELSIHKSIFNLSTQDADNECFNGGILDTILNNAPSATFGFLTAIPVPYVGCPIFEVTSMVARMGEIEG